MLRATTACTFPTSTSKSAPGFFFVQVDFEMCFAPQRRALFRQLNFQKYPKVLRTRQFLTLLTSKCDSRHNCVHFSTSTSKSAPRLFLCKSSQVDFEMCFVPQCRALFRQLNFQKYPQVLRTRQFLTLLTSKCDSRHNCVHFFNIATPKGARSMRFF